MGRPGKNNIAAMAHLIGGLYSVYYANTYADEIQGFIGIDSSVPKQNEKEPMNTAMLNKVMAYLGKARNALGISRLLSLGNPEKAIYVDPKYDYTEEEVETFRILTLDTSYNRTVMDELNWVEKNLDISEVVVLKGGHYLHLDCKMKLIPRIVNWNCQANII